MLKQQQPRPPPEGHRFEHQPTTAALTSKRDPYLANTASVERTRTRPKEVRSLWSASAQARDRGVLGARWTRRPGTAAPMSQCNHRRPAGRRAPACRPRKKRPAPSAGSGPSGPFNNPTPSHLQLEVLTGQISRVASFDLDLTHANIRSPQSETLHARELGSGSLPAAIKLPGPPPGDPLACVLPGTVGDIRVPKGGQSSRSSAFLAVAVAQVSGLGHSVRSHRGWNLADPKPESGSWF